MKTSVLDFIDSATLREHLCNQKLEPAIECILIVKSRTRSIDDKLEALEEMYETYSDDEFRKGKYNFREKNFRSALKEYIDCTKKAIFDMYCSDSDYVYHVEEHDDMFDICDRHGIFDSFDKALNAVETKLLPGHRLLITKARINELGNVTHTRALINEPGVPYDIWNLDNDRISCSFDSAYTWIPHRYAIGDLIRCSLI